MDSLLPAHLRNAEHLAAFEQVWSDRVETIDITTLMMYMVDSCSPKALPFLADQFNILTLRSWKLTTTDDQRRALIKVAIKTRGNIGTVDAVKTAIASLGFDPTHLVERCGLPGDPVHGWAQFKMAFTIHELTVTDPALFLLLSQLIEDSKPARCQYMGLDYTLDPIAEVITLSEVVTISASMPIAETLDVHNVRHDGTWLRSGLTRRRRGVEDVQYLVV
jgi:phage tail P2-like protein